jgi:hypothetical protein
MLARVFGTDADESAAAVRMHVSPMAATVNQNSFALDGVAAVTVCVFECLVVPWLRCCRRWIQYVVRLFDGARYVARAARHRAHRAAGRTCRCVSGFSG